jgi:mono/diheme cytochrome c family protein
VGARFTATLRVELKTWCTGVVSRNAIVGVTDAEARIGGDHAGDGFAAHNTGGLHRGNRGRDDRGGPGQAPNRVEVAPEEEGSTRSPPVLNGRAGLGVAVFAAALLAAGCGGSSAAPAPASTAAPDATTLYVRNCAACHRLAAADAGGTAGANLDELRPSRDAVLRAIADGPGLMPPRLLAGRDAELVARYVARVAGG